MHKILENAGFVDSDGLDIWVRDESFVIVYDTYCVVFANDDSFGIDCFTDDRLVSLLECL